MRKLQTDLLLIISLLVLALYAWKDIPQLVIRGDGFVYMVSSTINEFFSRKYWFTGFETSAALLGPTLSRFFKTNMSYYFYFSLSLMMVINVLFFILLRVITKHKLVSFFGALLLAVNYFGNFDMYSQHCYCYVIERVISVPFLLPAFLFLHLFLEKNIKKYLFISLGFYFFAVGIAHFALLFTAPYILYPFFWYFFKNKNIISRIKGIWIGGSYLLVSSFFVLIQRVHEPDFEKQVGLLEYFFKPHVTHYPEKIIREFVYWSQYGPIVLNFQESYLRRFLSVQNALSSTPYILSTYIFVILLVYIKLPRMRALLCTSILSTVIIFYLNAWFGQYDILYQPDTNRYLYFPTFLLSMFWTLFLWVIWKSKNIIIKLTAIILVCIYYFTNWWIINDTFRDTLFSDKSTKMIFNHMISMRPQLQKGTLVIAPDPEVWIYESAFFTEQIGKGEVEYLTDRNPSRNWVKVASSSSRVIKLKYDKKCDCVKEEHIK